MFQLRSAVYNTLRLNILNLKMAICNLIKDFPLKKSVDELNFYLAFLSEEELHCSCKQEESISVDELQVNFQTLKSDNFTVNFYYTFFFFKFYFRK